MVLWESDGLSVNEIAHKLILNTNTVTPLLKRMEVMGIIERHRSPGDERKVIIHLTENGKKLQTSAASIPENLISDLGSGAMNIGDLIDLKDKLNGVINYLLEKSQKKEDL
jgi:DNA-binding MarR family transcriptional regulator